MPGVPCSYKDVTRLDVAVPFFLREDVFSIFRQPNYDWTTDKKIVLLVKTVKRSPSKQGRSSSTPSEDNHSVGVGDNSLEGCPLECPFNLNESFEKPAAQSVPWATFVPLNFDMNMFDSMDLQFCRMLVNKLCYGEEEACHALRLDRQMTGKVTGGTPVYVACDGSPHAKDLVMIGFDDDKFLELRMMGPYKRKSSQLNLELFLAYHQHLPLVNPTSIRRQVHAVYEKIHGEFPAKGKVFIEFVWSDPKTLFESPCSQNALVKLAIRPQPGDAQPNLKKLWDDIIILDKFISDFQQTDLEASIHSLNQSAFENPVVAALTAILKEQSVPKWNSFDFSGSMDAALQRVIDLDRSDVDFTDVVWNALKNATHWEQLFEAYDFLFTAVESKSYRPYLLPSNNTLLGNCLRQLMANELTNFRQKLTVNFVVDMTLNCGLHKLFRDFNFIFTMCHLAEHSDTASFAPHGKLFRESVTNMKKLHCILEVLTLCRERLSLALPDQEMQTRRMLQYFRVSPLDWNYVFHFDVHMSAVSNAIIGLHPVYWNLQLESSNSVKAARTNAILSTEIFVGHAQRFYVTIDGTIPRGYYLYVHRVAQRKLSE